jgi:hypothetical protein
MISPIECLHLTVELGVLVVGGHALHLQLVLLDLSRLEALYVGLQLRHRLLQRVPLLSSNS